MDTNRYNELLKEYLATYKGDYLVRWDFQQKIFDEFLTNRFSFMQDVRCDASAGPGWVPILVEACEQIEEILKQHPGVIFHVDQVKEKFATLRFYVSAYSEAKDANGRPYQMTTFPEHEEARDKIYSIVDAAERKSESICEYCGAPGKVTGKGWIKTTCEEHA